MVKRTNKKTIRRARRHRKLFWIFGGTLTIWALLYWEQAALLYVLSTLAICGLMLVVAFSNLEGRDKEMHSRALEKLNTDSPDEGTQLENRVA